MVASPVKLNIRVLDRGKSLKKIHVFVKSSAINQIFAILGKQEEKQYVKTVDSTHCIFEMDLINSELSNQSIPSKEIAEWSKY